MNKDDKTPSPDRYEVGYGRPPRNTQFSKGKSGNPAGRPRKLKGKSVGGRALLVAKLGNSKDALEGGVKVTRKLIDFLIDHHLNAFITGKIKSIKPLLELLSWYDSHLDLSDASSEGVDHGAVVREKLEKLAQQLK